MPQSRRDVRTRQILARACWPLSRGIPPFGFADFVGAGTHLVAAWEGTVVDWSLAPGDLIGDACREAGRNLTLGEWHQYVGTFDAYERTCSENP